MDLKFLRKVLQGALIGLGAVLPGISGGVLSVVFGVYRPIMELLADPIHKGKTHLPELFPYMIGSAAGFLGVANLLSYLLNAYPDSSVCVFVGLIGGMLPSLWRETGAQGRTKKEIGISGVTFSIILSVLLWLQNSQIAVDTDFGGFFFCGFAFALSVIAPGMSFSALGHLDPTVLLPAGIGCGITFLCLVKLVNRLFERHYAPAFHAIFGIVSAATVMTIPWKSFMISADTASRNLLCIAAGITAAIVLEMMNTSLKIETE